MTQQTLLDDYTQISSTNREYTKLRTRWRFLLNSYVGGQDYRDAGYLTKYQLESASDYKLRCDTTPLDNHCQSVISVYMSYLFREEPDRDFEDWEDLPDVESFLEDCDYEGRTLDAFMKDVAIWSSVFGHVWILMTKPNLNPATLGEEQALGIRPYLNLLTPLAVLDWKWERQPNGSYKLVYLKYIEEIVDQTTTVRTWTPDTIETWTMDEDRKEAQLIFTEINQLGEIPAILCYNKRSIIKGIGVSDINDVADIQRMIYNLTSEAEQSHRMDGHPSLVITPDTQYGSGAGSVIVVPENSDPGLRPYYLEHGGANVQSLHGTIDKLVQAIDRLSHTGGVRGTEVRTLSGVAMEVEFSLLNARLSEKADNLELAEEQMWKLFGLYQGREWSGEVEYPNSFNIRDVQREFQQLSTAKSAATDPTVYRIIDEQIVELLGEEEERLPFIDPNPQTGRTYPDGEPIASSLPAAYQPASNPDVPVGQNCGNCEYYKPGELYCMKFDAPVRAVYWCAKWEPVEEEYSSELTAEQIAQIQEMLMSGMTNEEIMEAMPGITVEDIVFAAGQAAVSN